MAWLWLALAGMCEIIGVVGFARTSHGQRLSGLALAAESRDVPTVHALAMYDEPEMPAGFAHGRDQFGPQLVGQSPQIAITLRSG